ncbi:hypothetical protein Pelo_9870 [Pelomyxa schiedti]|nr:hypothetical protein Pelo_9870 [Pelomyxa schiedti]
MTTPYKEQYEAMRDACERGDMPELPPSPTWNINTPINGATMLHIACFHGHESLVGQLLGVGSSRNPPIDPNTPDCFGLTPLLYAVWQGKEAVVRMLVARPDVDVNKGFPLAVGCWWRRMGVVVALLECPRVDVNLVARTSGFFLPLNGQTALHVACEYGFVEGVKVLLQVNGIHSNRKNHKGETPLNVATRRHCTDICNLLKDRNASIVQSSRSTPSPRPRAPEAKTMAETAPTITTQTRDVPITIDTPKTSSTLEVEMREKETRIEVENKLLRESLREMNERVLILEEKLQEKEKRILTLEEENSVLKAFYQTFKLNSELHSTLFKHNMLLYQHYMISKIASCTQHHMTRPRSSTTSNHVDC